MCWLALNTAEGRLQMIIAEAGGEKPGAAAPKTHEISPLIRFAGHWHAPSQGAELLAPALADVCARLHMKVRDIRRIAVVRGPGSFTGIRLALATAAGLARATGAETGGIDYLPLLAASAHAALAPVLAASGPTSTGPVLLFALTHARRDLLHMQGFAADENGRLTALTGILVLSPAEAAARIAEISPGNDFFRPPSVPANDAARRLPALGVQGHDAPAGGLGAEPPTLQTAPRVLLFGSGLTRNRARIGEALRECALADAVMLPQAYDHPSHEALLGAAAHTAYSKADIEALYARPSDAEENLDRIAAGLGLAPERARTRLLNLTGRKS